MGETVLANSLVQRASDSDATEADDLSLAAAMRAIRQSKKISARALSLKAGLSQAYCGKVEKGHLEPSLRAFACIVRTLGLSPREVHLLVMREAMRVEHETQEGVTPEPYGGAA